MIDRAAVLAARDRVGDRVRTTPVLRADVPTPTGIVPVTFKLEQLQIGGSFKIRGSLNALLAAPEPPEQVVIASGGNAAIGAACAAALTKVHCVVVVPLNAPPTKLARLRELGAEIVVHGAGYAEAFEQATRIAISRDALQLHAYDLPEVVAGAGVIGLELDEQLAESGPVLVAVGGGGLVAGIATALASRRQVVGVEPRGIPTLHAALASGRPVDVGIDSIAADALGARCFGDIAMAVAQREHIGSVLVSDDAIVGARKFLWEQFRLAVEWAGATALAALLSGAYVPAPGVRPVLVVCGANTDPTSL